MSASASVLGPPATLVLTSLAELLAVTRNTRPRGRTTAARAVAASHLNTGCSEGHVAGSATRRCTHLVCSPCKRHPRSAGRRQKPPMATCCHLLKPLLALLRLGKRAVGRPAARTRWRRACARPSRARGQ